MPSKRDVSKLPKWARDRIWQLERDKQILTETLAMVNDVVKDGEEAVITVRHSFEHPPMIVKRGGDIKIALKHGVARIRVTKHGQIEVQSIDGQPMCLYPVVANTVYIDIYDYAEVNVGP